MSENLLTHPAYLGSTIEFVAVANESFSFLERSNSFEKQDFLARTAKLLALIYLKASMLEAVDPILEDEPERFVTEDEYNFVRHSIYSLLGNALNLLKACRGRLPRRPVASLKPRDVREAVPYIKQQV